MIKNISFFNLFLTCLTTIAYGNSLKTPLWVLLPNQQQLVAHLEDGQEAVPAWLAAELIQAAERLDTAWNAGNKILLAEVINNASEVALNSLLAEPDRFRARLCKMKALFGRSQNIDTQLTLIDPQHAWAVHLVDCNYRRPIEIYTVTDPKKFTRGQLLRFVGFFLCLRRAQLDGQVAQDGRAAGADMATVPVFVGVLEPMVLSEKMTVPLDLSVIVGIIVSMGLIYVFVRRYALGGGRSGGADEIRQVR